MSFPRILVRLLTRRSLSASSSNVRQANQVAGEQALLRRNPGAIGSPFAGQVLRDEAFVQHVFGCLLDVVACRLLAAGLNLHDVPHGPPLSAWLPDFGKAAPARHERARVAVGKRIHSPGTNEHRTRCCSGHPGMVQATAPRARRPTENALIGFRHHVGGTTSFAMRWPRHDAGNGPSACFPSRNNTREYLLRCKNAVMPPTSSHAMSREHMFLQ